ncbi:MAG TPA: ATP-binding protein [Dictyobacter sp.]|nr:ATP-binding protein [Dictyobacter sp.]
MGETAKIIPFTRSTSKFDVRLQEFKRKLGIPETPEGPEPSRADNEELCPTCKCPISEYTYGYTVRRPEGERESFREPCPTCSPAVIERRLKRQMERNLHNCFQMSNIPEDMYDWSFDTVPDEIDQDALEMMQGFATGAAFRNVYLWGDMGHGKTSLAISAMREFMKRGIPCLYINSSWFIEMVRKQQNGHMEARDMYGNVLPDLLELAYNVDVLLLDDMGVGKPTDFVIDKFYNIIEERRNRSKYFTILTSNYNLRGLVQRYTLSGVDFQPFRRVAVRIKESYTLIEVKGAHLRDDDF